MKMRIRKRMKEEVENIKDFDGRKSVKNIIKIVKKSEKLKNKNRML